MGCAKKGFVGPWDVISVAIDGFHQQKAEIPNSMSRYATLEKSFKVKVHLVGTMIHGRPQSLFGTTKNFLMIHIQQ